MAPTKRHPKPKSLAHGRPFHLRRPASLSSKATRTLIRTHHTLEKQRAKAISSGNTEDAANISRQIEAHGGIETYQRASLLGQGNERGGDSSRILMGWLDGIVSKNKEKDGESKMEGKGQKLRMLEVGALSTANACSRSGLFDIERIDLNSQAEGITQQDFMERPLPTSASSADQFDIISLSLVLNFVPDPTARGEMLKRTLCFLRPTTPSAIGQAPNNGDIFPCLFLVLPAPCVLNSRYLDESRLEAIMSSLGYTKLEKKLSNKLAYYLWKATNLVPQKRMDAFKKLEVRAGNSRNNFAIVLK